MAQLSDDCFAFGGKLMTATEALDLLAQRITTVADPETVPLRAGLGRILAQNVIAARAVPPHDNSAVDGYAVAFGDLTPGGESRLKVVGRIAAGQMPRREAQPGEAVRIFTGAPMPKRADTVLMQEDCRVDDDIVVIPPGIKRGSNRRNTGEDVAAGAMILRAGVRLRPQDIGLAASVGCTELSVYRKLTVALFSTGDELRDAGDELPPGCVYDANRHVLASLLASLPCEVRDLGILGDNYETVHDALDRAAQSSDLIVTSGGVSTGEEDHVRAAVEALGKMHFWRLAIRPGRPIALGQIGRVPFVGLPGNPVAMMVTFMRIARPAILKLAGCADASPLVFRVRANFDYKKKQNRREWLRVRVHPDADGVLRAEKFPRDGAGILSSMVEADGLVELPEELTQLAPGTMVDFLPFSGMT